MKTIEESFQDYLKHVYKKPLSPSAELHMRAAFMAGAALANNTIFEASSKKDGTGLPEMMVFTKDLRQRNIAAQSMLNMLGVVRELLTDQIQPNKN